MNNKEIMLEYIRRFRLECHYRLDMTASEYKELPIHIYKGAHSGALNEMTSDYNLNDDFQERLDSIYNFFEDSILKEDDYNAADDLTVEAIERGQF